MASNGAEAENKFLFGVGSVTPHEDGRSAIDISYVSNAGTEECEAVLGTVFGVSLEAIVESGRARKRGRNKSFAFFDSRLWKATEAGQDNLPLQ